MTVSYSASGLAAAAAIHCYRGAHLNSEPSSFKHFQQVAVIISPGAGRHSRNIADGCTVELRNGIHGFGASREQNPIVAAAHRPIACRMNPDARHSESPAHQEDFGSQIEVAVSDMKGQNPVRLLEMRQID